MWRFDFFIFCWYLVFFFDFPDRHQLDGVHRHGFLDRDGILAILTKLEPHFETHVNQQQRRRVAQLFPTLHRLSECERSEEISDFSSPFISEFSRMFQKVLILFVLKGTVFDSSLSLSLNEISWQISFF